MPQHGPRRKRVPTGEKCWSCKDGIQTVVYQKTGKTGTRICNACSGKGTK